MRLAIPAAIAVALIALGAEAGYATTPGQVTDRAGDSKPGYADIKSASEQLSSSFASGRSWGTRLSPQRTRPAST
jgi:hypothetical protein